MNFKLTDNSLSFSLAVVQRQLRSTEKIAFCLIILDFGLDMASGPWRVPSINASKRFEGLHGHKYSLILLLHICHHFSTPRNILFHKSKFSHSLLQSKKMRRSRMIDSSTVTTMMTIPLRCSPLFLTRMLAFLTPDTSMKLRLHGKA